MWFVLLFVVEEDACLPGGVGYFLVEFFLGSDAAVVGVADVEDLVEGLFVLLCLVLS